MWFPTGNFLASVLLPNTPQLILSCAYFAYNALYTRLLTESEWQSFSLGYRPLRVTNPQGEQWSTFRLQLPYRYSIPLLVTGILLHWITSSAIFLFMSDGGKFNIWRSFASRLISYMYLDYLSSEMKCGSNEPSWRNNNMDDN